MYKRQIRGIWMYLFDLHCDTVTRLHDGERLAPGDRSLRQNGAHLALGRMACYDWCQCFAIFMPDEYRGEAAVDYFESCYRFFTGQLAENADLAAQAFTAADIREIISGGRCAALLTVEDVYKRQLHRRRARQHCEGSGEGGRAVRLLLPRPL